MGTLQENQSLNAEYERNKKEREMKEEIERLNNIINKAIEYMNYTFNISSVKEMYEIMNELEKILKESDKK